MVSTDLNTYVTFGYMLCVIAYLTAYTATPAESRTRQWVFAILIVVWGVHTGAIGLRWVESYRMGIGHAPLSNLYESLIFFGWSIALALILIRVKFRSDIVVLLGLPIVFLVMAYTFLEDHTIKPLIPALQSNWLVAHVITCFLGYAGFAVSFVAAVLLLLSKRSDLLGKSLPSEILDEIVYRSILLGTLC